MNTVMVVGDHFSTRTKEVGAGVRLIDHVITRDVQRTKTLLQSYLFSILVEGTKVVHTTNNSSTIDSEKFLLLLSGNYLMTEKITSSDGRFQSILIFFSQEMLNDFFSNHADIVLEKATAPMEQVQVFEKDQFIKNFIHSLLLMCENGKEIPPTLQQLKLEELMLYLCYRDPEKMQVLKSRANNNVGETEIKKLVESNIGTNITLEELAFLCNMSLSTFKRKFISLYSMTPSKWFLQRKMELAMTLLRTGKEKPGEIYHKVGYESHSSFTHSFKQVVGITPTEYHRQSIAN